MKGAIFIALNEMIEQEFGIEVWDELLEAVAPKSQGIYTSTEDYDEQEIVDFVIAISEKINMPANDVKKLFGQFLFGELNRKYPIFTQLSKEYFPFLMSIHGVIHNEVQKLYNEPSLPTIQCEQIAQDTMEMIYSSPRKLCHLAEGLILGAGIHYGHDIKLTHDRCMHDNHDSCRIEIKITGNI